MVTATKQLSERLRNYDQAGFPWASRIMLLGQIQDAIAQNAPVIFIEGDMVAEGEYHLRDPKRNTGIDIQVHARRLGTDPGSDILYEWGTIFTYIADKHREGIRSSLPPDQLKLWNQWCQENPI